MRPRLLNLLLLTLVGTPLRAQDAADTPMLRAELHRPDAVWMILTGADRPLDPAAYQLLTDDGEAIAVAAVVPSTATRTLVVPAKSLDVGRVYYLDLPGLDLRTRCRFDGWFRDLYSPKPLGAEVGDGATTFRVFAPRVATVRLYLYRTADAAPEDAEHVIEMTQDDAGVWEATVDGDRHGTYYDFTVHGGDRAGEPGTFFYETHPAHISDPYARVNVEAFGKSRVWRATTPATPLPNGRPAMEDVVAYEVHVQDFTDRLPVSDDLKGTLPAMAEPGLRNAHGEPVGFDYLVDLGVNVVHLMPVQEYLHYPDAEWQAAFAEDPFAQAMGIAEENYQWGYRTTHAFAIETRFRRRGTEHGAQREQFRDLVQAFHDRGIAVIIDIVPNHTGENMDGRNYLFNFNVLDRYYYYRLDDDGNHIGPFGNEVKTEDRPMVQRWIIDQCVQLIEEFGIDGFRIDLAGQIDEQTLIALREAVGPDVILYGEPWIDVTDPYVRANPDWDWYKEDAPITFFQDDARNAFKGSPFQLENKQTDRGYAGGIAAARAAAMRALTNRYVEESESPNEGINYLDIHDNWALPDRFATVDWNGLEGVAEGPFKVAAGLLFTSVGPIVLHGGTEMLRSKGLAPLAEFERETASGPIQFKGRDDTYNVRTPNHFVWDTLGDPALPYDAAAMRDYWKGLIALRMSAAGSVFRVAEPVPEGYYAWILPANEHMLGYVVDERVAVLLNTDQTAQTFEDVPLPAGTWRLVANADAVDLSGVGGSDANLQGGAAHDLRLPATSLKIWVRE